GPQLMDYFATGRVLQRNGNADLAMYPHGVYPCADDGKMTLSAADAVESPPGRWVAIAVRDAGDWRSLCRVIGRPEWADDPAMQDADGRRARAEAIEAAICAWTCTRFPEDAMEELVAAGVPAGAVRTPEDLFADPQLADRGHFWYMEHAVIGRHAYDAPVWKLSETPAQPRRPGPALGQHTHQICSDILGLTDEEIAALTAEGVFE